MMVLLEPELAPELFIFSFKFLHDYFQLEGFCFYIHALIYVFNSLYPPSLRMLCILSGFLILESFFFIEGFNRFLLIDSLTY